MHFSNIAVATDGRLIKDDKRLSDQPFHIVLLDDHQIFTDGLRTGMLDIYFPTARLSAFSNGDMADKFIRQEIRQSRKIDLLITDIIHPGIPGDILAELIRLYERSYRSAFRIPIMVLSMVDRQFLSKGGSDLKCIDHILPKSAATEEIAGVLFDVLYGAGNNDSAD